MPRLSTNKQLVAAVRRLREQRALLGAKLAEIDRLFEEVGITPESQPPRNRPGRPPGKRGPGRPPGTPAIETGNGRRARRHRGRGRFATPGPASILQFVRAGGSKGRTTSEVNKNWKGEGRSGDAYVQLGDLVKAKKLKRENLVGQRGSRYTMSS